MIEKGGYRGRSTKFNAKYFVINNAAPDRWEPEVAVSTIATANTSIKDFPPERPGSFDRKTAKHLFLFPAISFPPSPVPLSAEKPKKLHARSNVKSPIWNVYEPFDRERVNQLKSQLVPNGIVFTRVALQRVSPVKRANKELSGILAKCFLDKIENKNCRWKWLEMIGNKLIVLNIYTLDCTKSLLLTITLHTFGR